MMKIEGSLLQSHLRAIVATELQDRIRQFRSLNHRTLSYTELQSEILKVLSVPETNNALLLTCIKEYPVGTKFFRVRKAGGNDGKIPLRCLSVESDAWSPPANVCNLGRLNKAGEPLLYTSPINLAVALDEMRVEPADLCCSIVYKSIHSIKVSIIAARAEFIDITDEERLKLNMLYDFLHDEFTREVGSGSEHLYRISEIIAKDYFDLPPRDIQDAWCYPSVAAKPSFNVAFRPEIAREKLRLECVLLGHRRRSANRDGLEVKVVVEWIEAEQCYRYHLVGSEAQKRLAPEIVCT